MAWRSRGNSCCNWYVATGVTACALWVAKMHSKCNAHRQAPGTHCAPKTIPKQYGQTVPGSSLSCDPASITLLSSKQPCGAVCLMRYGQRRPPSNAPARDMQIQSHRLAIANSLCCISRFMLRSEGLPRLGQDMGPLYEH